MNSTKEIFLKIASYFKKPKEMNYFSMPVTTSYIFIIFYGILNVNYSFCITLKPIYDLNQGDNKFFDIKKTLRFECVVDEETEITWMKIESNETKTLLKGEFTKENLTSSLVINPAFDEHAGIYSCSIKTRKNETISKSFRAIGNIRVLVKSVDVVEGEQLQLKCSGVGTGLVIGWTLPENVTNEEVSYKKSDDKGFNNDTLVIKDVKDYHRGNYTCEGRYDSSMNIPTEVTSVAVVRVKDKYAALGPFIMICVEVLILCVIILICEKRRTHENIEDSETEVDPKNGKN